MEMSQRIYFQYQILLKVMIFEKMAKKQTNKPNTFLVKNFCDKLTKIALS